MKKILTLILSFTLVFCLTSCGKGGNENSTQSSQEDNSTKMESTQEPSESAEVELTDEETVSETSSESQPEGTEDGKILVVYYSATNNTKGVAEHIATETGGDLFEIVPKNPYSSDDLDWRNNNSRVSVEHDNPDQRVVELENANVTDWDSYDTVFIGYPIWWGIAAWPVDGFIAANDFSGKTVIPFCTSSSSDLGESGKLLAEAAGTGDWLEGKRFSSGADEETIREWVNQLGIK